MPPSCPKLFQLEKHDVFNFDEQGFNVLAPVCVLPSAPPGAPGSCCDSRPRLENWFPTSSCQQSHIAGRGSSTLPLFQKTFFKGDVLDFSCSGLPLPPPKPSLWSFLHCQPARAEDWGGYWGPGRQLLSPKYQFLNFLSECQLIVSYCW